MITCIKVNDANAKEIAPTATNRTPIIHLFFTNKIVHKNNANPVRTISVSSLISFSIFFRFGGQKKYVRSSNRNNPITTIQMLMINCRLLQISIVESDLISCHFCFIFFHLLSIAALSYCLFLLRLKKYYLPSVVVVSSLLSVVG